MWGWIAWVAVALVVWVAVAALVGVLLGRVVRRRDRQVPDSMAPVPVSDLPPGVQASIDHAIREGKTINAIKIYRDATSASVAQAKQAIDVRSWEHKP